MRCYFRAAIQASPILVLEEACPEVIDDSGMFQSHCLGVPQFIVVDMRLLLLLILGPKYHCEAQNFTN